MTTICVDVMGADKEPEVLLEGVTRALEKDPDLCVLLAGSADVVEPYCASHERARALVTTEVIGMAEHPASAVRQKKDASIVRAAAAVRAGEADGLFSAGSTGAVLTAATFGVGRIKGVKRPALSLPFPGLGSHKTIFLDMGANADVKPEVMVQFAHMGRAFAEVALGVSDARVGLLCNGSEDTKGSEMALAYHEALANGSCGFAGNAEGTDVLGDRFDVIVCDGFTGNVCLKTIEGTGKFVLLAREGRHEGLAGRQAGRCASRRPAQDHGGRALRRRVRRRHSAGPARPRGQGPWRHLRRGRLRRNALLRRIRPRQPLREDRPGLRDRGLTGRIKGLTQLTRGTRPIQGGTMDRDAILQKVIEVVNDTLDIADGTELTEQTSFKDLGADSFDLLELVTALEDELDMQFDDDAVQSIATIGQAVDAIAAEL